MLLLLKEGEECEEENGARGLDCPEWFRAEKDKRSNLTTGGREERSI